LGVAEIQRITLKSFRKVGAKKLMVWGFEFQAKE